MPQRIQRKRTKGWRMPEGAVYVGRPSRWGNPFGVEQANEGGWYVVQRSRRERWWTPDNDTKECAVALAVKVYRGEIGGFWNAGYREHVRRELAGRDLACWCPLEDATGNPVPCHADVLLEVANAPR